MRGIDSWFFSVSFVVQGFAFAFVFAFVFVFALQITQLSITRLSISHLCSSVSSVVKILILLLILFFP